MPAQNTLTIKLDPSKKVDHAGGERNELWNRVVFASGLLWTFLCLCFPLLDFDFWWHLKTGEWILANGQVPFVDLFTFTDAERPWVDMHWGFQILVTLLYRMGGVPLVTLVKAATYTAAVAIAWKAGGEKLPNWIKGIAWFLPIICITGRGNERPEMLSLLFLAMWLWIAVKSDRRPHLFWWLPLVQLLWVNSHALFVLGLVTGFCYAIDAIAREVTRGSYGLSTRDEAPPLQMVLVVALLVAVACFCNPYFEEGVLFPLTLFRKFTVDKEFYAKNIGEFHSPYDHFRKYGLSNIYLLSEVGVWVIAVFSFVRLGLKRRRVSVFRLLMFSSFSYLAWQASRNTNIFSIVAGFVTCENLADAEGGSTIPASARVPVRPSQSVAAVFTVFSLLVVTGLWNQFAEKNKPFGLGEAPDYFIHDAAKFAGQPGFPGRAYVAHIGQAEVYAYHNGPDKRVFMDARLEVCTQDTFELYNRIFLSMAQGNPGWQTVFGNEELPVVILDSRTSWPAIYGMLTLPTWRLVFADRTGAVFLTVEKADQLKLPKVDPEALKLPPIDRLIEIKSESDSQTGPVK